MSPIRPRAAVSLHVLAVACAALTACTDDPHGIRLRFVADPALNSEAQVMGVIDRIEVVVGRTGGFKITGSGDSTWHAADLDGDRAHELVLSQTVAGALTFPFYRLLPGGQQATEVELWARGLVGPEVAAIGARASATFRPDRGEDVTLPLDLRARFRPPRVLLTLPHTGQAGVPPALGRIYLEFSKWIAAESVSGNLSVLYAGTAGERQISGGWQLSHTSVHEHGLPEERTIATLDLGSCSLSPGEYRIEVRTGITDVSGNPLDQDAMKSGASGFSSSFTVAGQPQAEPCSTRVACRDSSECNPDGSDVFAFVCVKDAGAATGRCLPLPESCNSFNCPTGYVCDMPGTAADGTLSSDGECVRDCRLDQSVCAVGTPCDLTSGLCRSSSNSTCTGSDCDPSGGLICDNGECPDWPAPDCNNGTCTSESLSCLDAPCPPGSGCDLESGACVQCTTSQGCCGTDSAAGNTTGCQEGTYCDPNSGACVPRPQASN